MVKVSVKEVSSCEKIVTVDVSAEQIQQEYEKFYSEIAKVAKVPGFRPGKVPRDVLVIHFKDSAREEVLKKLIPRSLSDAFQQKEIAPISNPSIERVDFDQDHLRYDAHIEIRPKIKIDKYKGLSIKQKSVTVPESDVEETLKRIQDTHAKFVPASNRAAVMGDHVVCDYVCTVDGKEIEKRNEDLISLKEKDYLDGFSKQLVGVLPGETRDVKVIFPENYVNKSFAGKEGLFKVSVKELKIREAPALDDEFAKEVGEFQTLEELKNKIREQIKSRKEEEQQHILENALLDELLSKSKFEIPKKMIERRMDAMLEETLHSLRHQGMTEDAEKNQATTLREKMRPEAERQIRISFLLDEIAKKENIQAEEKDFDLKYEVIAKRYQRPVEEVKAQFEKSEGRKDSLEYQIVTEKTIEFLRNHASIKTD